MSVTAILITSYIVGIILTLFGCLVSDHMSNKHKLKNTPLIVFVPLFWPVLIPVGAVVLIGFYATVGLDKLARSTALKLERKS
jgi:hypothetical protein